MILLWGSVLGIPLLAVGVALVACPDAVRRFSRWFRASRPVAAALTVVAWFWTAWECDTVGIEVFDMITKVFPGELWILAVVLSYLTFVWMPANLPVRALTGLMMLFPTELFKTTRQYLPEAGTVFAAVDVFFWLAYAAIVVGMYGMFYPWRLEKGFDLAVKTDVRARAFGVVLAFIGAAVLSVAFYVR